MRDEVCWNISLPSELPLRKGLDIFTDPGESINQSINQISLLPCQYTIWWEAYINSYTAMGDIEASAYWSPVLIKVLLKLMMAMFYIITTYNEFLLRPLEFPALHGCTDLAYAIMHTKGVYLIKEESVGYNVVQYFDISEYELFDNGLPPRFSTHLWPFFQWATLLAWRSLNAMSYS